MTAVEVIVALAIFSVMLLILTSLQMQFLRFEKRTDLEFFEHPQRLAVLERLRADVQDSLSYPVSHGEWVQNQSTLIVQGAQDHVVVWRFEAETAERSAWKGNTPVRTWRAHGVPRFEIAAVDEPSERVGVRLRAFDDDERLIFDQIVFPRAH